MKNSKVRLAAMEAGVKLWQVAERLGINDGNLSRRLRQELPEEEQERLVTTPWFDHEVSLSEAAEKGTHKVIAEHSTIGIVVTTDGTICDIERENYREPEENSRASANPLSFCSTV